MSSRREFLASLATVSAAGALAPRTAMAIGEPPVSAARLAVPGLKPARPGAVATLMRVVGENTSVVTAPDVPEVAGESTALFSYPFVVLAGDDGFEPLPDEAVTNLRLFLREGGFLFIDDASGVRGSEFDQSVRRDLARILPGTELARIGRDHAVYRSFFLMGRIAGRVEVQSYLEGLWVGDITPVLYSVNDLLGAWLEGPGGRPALDCVPDGERQRLTAERLGLNLVLFALTSNYKRDAVHVRTLLERMSRQGGYSR